METILSTTKLSKRYGDALRVKEVNLSVREGEIYGFLGPNGAGKSTTLKMLLGLVRPTSGQVQVFGKELQANRRFVLSQIGSLIESPSYYGHLTGLENMRVVQKLRAVPAKNIEEALKIVRLEKQKEKQVEKYSLGMKQRLGIAMALLSFPKLLILDEPTNGLDPAGIGEIRELIKALPQQYGMTILLSSHLLSEIDQIATSVGIINHGHMLFQGKLSELHQKNQPRIIIKTTDNRAARDVLMRAGFFPGVEEGALVFEKLADRQVAQANRSLLAEHIDVLRIEEQKRSLEDMFLKLTGGGESL